MLWCQIYPRLLFSVVGHRHCNCLILFQENRGSYLPESNEFGLNVSPIIRNGVGEGTQMKKVAPILLFRFQFKIKSNEEIATSLPSHQFVPVNTVNSCTILASQTSSHHFRHNFISKHGQNPPTYTNNWLTTKWPNKTWIILNSEFRIPCG